MCFDPCRETDLKLMQVAVSSTSSHLFSTPSRWMQPWNQIIFGDIIIIYPPPTCLEAPGRPRVQRHGVGHPAQVDGLAPHLPGVEPPEIFLLLEHSVHRQHDPVTGLHSHDLVLLPVTELEDVEKEAKSEMQWLHLFAVLFDKARIILAIYSLSTLLSSLILLPRTWTCVCATLSTA